MMIDSESSNYHALEEVLEALKNGKPTEDIILSIEKFLEPKRVIDNEIRDLSIKARLGNKQAAKDLIEKLAEMGDGPSL